jgi:hypothetical protein
VRRAGRVVVMTRLTQKPGRALYQLLFCRVWWLTLVRKSRHCQVGRHGVFQDGDVVAVASACLPS